MLFAWERQPRVCLQFRMWPFSISLVNDFSDYFGDFDYSETQRRSKAVQKTIDWRSCLALHQTEGINRYRSARIIDPAGLSEREVVCLVWFHPEDYPWWSDEAGLV